MLAWHCWNCVFTIHCENEKDKKYPVERYWDEQEEKQQNTSGDDTQTDCDAEEKM